MDIEYIAFDSFGVKSSCIFVKTSDCKICVDPGIAVETSSFPLSFAERIALDGKYRGAIKDACDKSDVVVITHYHYDHHIPDANLYKGKHLLIKDPVKNINRSQAGRAEYFLGVTKKKVKKIEIADGRRYDFGSTRITFSKPLWHGVRGTNLGYVVMVKIQDDEKTLLHTSDVDGPILRNTTELIIKQKPDILILDGPPTYLLGYLHAYYNLARSIINTCWIMSKTNTELILIDHHLVRDYRYPDLYCEVYARAKKLGKSVCTAAEFLGKRPEVLRGYTRHGPTKWKNWEKFEKKDIFNVLENAIKAKLIKKIWLERANNYFSQNS
jgi:hypothetical protein